MVILRRAVSVLWWGLMLDWKGSYRILRVRGDFLKNFEDEKRWGKDY